MVGRRGVASLRIALLSVVVESPARSVRLDVRLQAITRERGETRGPVQPKREIVERSAVRERGRFWETKKETFILGATQRVVSGIQRGEDRALFSPTYNTSGIPATLNKCAVAYIIQNRREAENVDETPIARFAKTGRDGDYRRSSWDSRLLLDRRPTIAKSFASVR